MLDVAEWKDSGREDETSGVPAVESPVVSICGFSASVSPLDINGGGIALVVPSAIFVE